MPPEVRRRAQLPRYRRAGNRGRRPLIAALALAALLAPPAQAAWWLVAPSPQIAADRQLELFVVRDAADPPLPERLVLTLESAGPPRPIELTASAPESGYRRHYRGVIAGELHGMVRLGFADGHRLQLAAPPATATGPADAPPPGPTTVAAPALSGHEPMYFLIGRRHITSARFQFSFKYRIFDDESAVVRWLPPLSGLHFAYSQTSLWDLTGESKPFRDNSYRPALLYQWHAGPAIGAHRAWRVEGGIEHESNGRDGERSRSINIAYLKPERRFALSPRRYLSVGAKLYHYLDREENPDIVDFRGRADYQLRLGKDDGWQWSMIVRRGEAGVGSIQNEWSYPLRRPFFADAGGYVFIQHFAGFGETLLDYRTRNAGQLRFGFAIVR